MAAHYFAGGNTELGFFSRFGDILPEAERKRMIFLKGGPGVGKSSLMKRVADAYESNGYEIERFHCSSDPESLDGLSVPSLGFAMLDGTAPHVCDPRLPAARDELVNLERFLDREPLRRHRAEIERLSNEITLLFQRAYGFLGAAGKVLDASCCGSVQPKALAELCDTLTERYLPLRGGYGSSRELFADAFTPQGRVSYLQTLPQTCVVALAMPFGLSADPLLQALCGRARLRGLDVIRLLDPLQPLKLAHLYLPAHKLLFTTTALPKATETLAADAFCDLRDSKEEGFDRNACELLLQRAVEQIRAAKALHDQLETFYTPAMDFQRWQDVLEELLPKENA